MSQLSRDWRISNFSQRFQITFELFIESIRYQSVFIAIMILFIALCAGPGLLIDIAMENSETLIFTMLFGAVPTFICAMLISISNCIIVDVKISDRPLPQMREMASLLWKHLFAVLWPNGIPVTAFSVLYLSWVGSVIELNPEIADGAAKLISRMLFFVFVYFWFITPAIIFEGKRGFSAIWYSIRISSWSVIWLHVQTWIFGLLAGIGLLICMAVVLGIYLVDSSSYVVLGLCGLISAFVFGAWTIVNNLFSVFLFLRLRDEKFPAPVTVPLVESASSGELPQSQAE
jgi:hypothetical protein